MAPPPPRSSAPLRDLAQDLDRLLSAQLGRLRRRFLLHGFGWLAALLACVVLVYYAADWLLGLPSGVRILLTTAIAAFLVIELRRRIVYPLSRALQRDDIAVALERRFPELRERLISAVQLAEMAEAGEGRDRALRNQSAAMIERLVQDTAVAAQRIPANDLLDPRRTAMVWSIAAAASLGIAVAVLANPTAFGVFMSRAVGLGASYPRLTTLVVELPEGRPEYRIERDGRRARVTMAAGDELPVMVRAEGVVPREVALVVEGGRGMPPQVAMTARGSARFRHVFRRVTTGFTFHALGGDDDRGDLDVEVVTVQPPRVANIRATLTPPAYTGLERITQAGGAVEAVEGTVVDVHVTATAKVASASLTFLESGRELQLALETVSDDHGTREILTGRFVVETSDRYQVRLTSDQGMRNPHPGTYPVIALTDHAPQGRLLSPTDDTMSVALPNALIPLRIEARDDYGLTSVQGLIELGKVEGEGAVDLLPEKSGAVQHAVLTHLIEVDKLSVAGSVPSIGDIVTLRALITDNRQPEPHSTKLPGQPVHVVGHADLSRRIAGHFRRIRETVGEALDMQTRLHDRLLGAAEELETGSRQEVLRGDLTVVQVGQARLLGRAARFHVELMRSFDLHLFNRLDDSPHAQRTVELFSTYHAEHPEAEAFLPGFYEMLGRERKAGNLGPMPKTLDPILEMTLAAGRIATDLGPAAVKALEAAAAADDAGAVATALDQGGKLQRVILAELESLQGRLDEWNEFQDVIIHTRSVLDKQREVQVRTRDALRGQGEEKRSGR